MKYLVHNYVSVSGNDTIDLQLDDHWFRMTAGEPIDLDTDSNGHKVRNPDFYAHHLIQQYGPLYGIVEVPATRDRSGVHLDIDRALELADASLKQCRITLINHWVSDQLQDRVRQNLPVLPPTGLIEEAIKILNIDLQAKYGIRPLGWDWTPDTRRPIDGARSVTSISNISGSNNDQRVAALEGQLEEMKQMMAELLSRGGGSAPVPPAQDVEDGEENVITSISSADLQAPTTRRRNRS